MAPRRSQNPLAGSRCLHTSSLSLSLPLSASRTECLLVAGDVSSTYDATGWNRVASPSLPCCFPSLLLPFLSLLLLLDPSSSSCQTELLIIAGSASDPATPSTPSAPRAASFSPRLKNRRVRLLLSLFESPALCVMLTHLCKDLSVLCSLMNFAVTSASACVAPSSD